MILRKQSHVNCTLTVKLTEDTTTKKGMTTVQRAAELCLKLASGFMQRQYDLKLKVDGSTASYFEYPKMILHNQIHVNSTLTIKLTEDTTTKKEYDHSTVSS